MSRADRERWNRKYAAGNPDPAFTPDPILVRYAHLLAPPGLALDVACGVGQNALFLARRGYEVVAVDGSLVGLQHARAVLRGSGLAVHLVAADLDQFTPPPGHFDLVLVIRFLSRPLLPALKYALKPGGLMFCHTFNLNRLHTNPAFDREYLLRPGELAAQFADFEQLASNDAPGMDDELSFWIGRRPRH